MATTSQGPGPRAADAGSPPGLARGRGDEAPVTPETRQSSPDTRTVQTSHMKTETDSGMDYLPPSPPSQPSDTDLSGLKQLAEISLATAAAPGRPDFSSLLTSLLYPSLTISPSASPSPPPAHASPSPPPVVYIVRGRGLKAWQQGLQWA